MHAKEKAYDIILMDTEFESASGIEAVKQINAWHPDSQIIYITNHVTYFSSVYETSHIFYILKKDIDKYLQTALKSSTFLLAAVSQRERARASFCFCSPLLNS
mgnify:CR=1 FL=1